MTDLVNAVDLRKVVFFNMSKYLANNVLLTYTDNFCPNKSGMT